MFGSWNFQWKNKHHGSHPLQFLLKPDATNSPQSACISNANLPPSTITNLLKETVFHNAQNGFRATFIGPEFLPSGSLVFSSESSSSSSSSSPYSISFTKVSEIINRYQKNLEKYLTNRKSETMRQSLFSKPLFILGNLDEHGKNKIK